MERPQHVPVLLEESLEYLQVNVVKTGGVFVDATLGFGGHAMEIARRLGSTGRLIAFDRDPEAMARAKARLAALAEELGPEMPAVEYVNRPFSEIADVVAPGTLDGLLADFGVSSMQLDEAHRGFSFRAEGPLDMRMDPRSGLTAEQVVNQADEEELANLIYEFGEERRSRRIARAI
ncbi:MAG TPA: 16S rRNA (cytosine(1402)-N(4))-methyltransferase RsmH, partial [Acidobacteriaceae bacterium]|nr:16S rRNA (cytosine(1402)-N(4))-methyltransferase RsmH [Acidobacteriaceae bacterium]